MDFLSDNRLLHEFALGTHSTLFIKVTSFIRKTRVDDLIADFHPDIARSRGRAQSTKQIISAACNDEAAEEVQVVDILRADGDFNANGTYEADNVDQNPGNVGGVGAPVEAEIVIVR